MSGLWAGLLLILALALRRLVLVVVKDTLGRAVEIVVLPAFERPEKGREPKGAHQESERDEEDQDLHGCLSAFSRNAFSVTISEEEDITTAAISGVTYPATASGTAIRL